uniref:Endo-1,4-beta-xylanase A n=1 Tax=uncultured bacterium contig00190 TaxID=1181604 RepID=A0A806K2P5_9BACT|nr:endo-1,4-beta-xylanase A precursor [uncultured bacterium contig00190]
MKTLLIAMLFALLCFANVFAAPAAINLSTEYQKIHGFGGMNHPVWIGDLTAAQRETVFGNGPNQLGFTVLRIWVSDNTSQWSREVETAKYAYDRGFLVFASPWNPPSSMTETFTRGSQTNAKRLRASSYGAYATHLNDFVTYMKNQGVNLYAISVQNEPDYAEEWTWWTSSEIITFLKNNARSINCKIIAPEEFQYTKSLITPILNDPQALANVDIIGTHLYGTPYNSFPYPLFKEKGAGKELWMTEVYRPNSSDDADLWPQALEVAQHVHSAMADAEFQMYVWWYIRRYYSPLKEDGNISKRGYMMAHFSKFVRPGAVRIDATKTPETDVYVSAYKSSGADSLIIVAVNKKTSAVSQVFNISNGTVSKVESWRTTGTQNMAKQTDIDVTSGSFTASLPAQSVTTFVGIIQKSSSSSSITPSSSSSSTPPSSSSTTPSSSSSTVPSSSSRPPSSSSAIPSSSSAATPSSSSEETPSSSSEESTPILLPQTHVVRALRATPPQYYNLKGEPLGTTKPSNPGVYIEKNGKQARKIVVK